MRAVSHVSGSCEEVLANPELVREAKRLARKNPKTGEKRSLREIAAELERLGFVNSKGKPLAANQVARLIES